MSVIKNQKMFFFRFTAYPVSATIWETQGRQGRQGGQQKKKLFCTRINNCEGSWLTFSDLTSLHVNSRHLKKDFRPFWDQIEVPLEVYQHISVVHKTVEEVQTKNRAYNERKGKWPLVIHSEHLFLPIKHRPYLYWLIKKGRISMNGCITSTSTYWC